MKESPTTPNDYSLCSDTLTHTMLFMDVKEIILNCSLVSKQWHRCSMSNTIWKEIYEEYFMESIFDWKTVDLKSSSDNSSSSSDSGSDEERIGDDEEKKKRKLGESKQHTNKNKRKKQQDTSYSDQNYYWFDLFKLSMKFPILDNLNAQIKKLVLGNVEEILKIHEVNKLHQVITCMHDFMNDKDDPQLIDNFQYKCLYQFNKADSSTIRTNYLKLAIILSVMYNGASISYFRDSVVVSLRKIKGGKKKKENKENEEIYPLPVFCMMILYPDSLNALPFLEDEKNGLFYCVAPYLESNDDYNNELSHKDCCFFTVMEREDDEDAYTKFESDEIIINKDNSDQQGFCWCPEFFNAGSKQHTNKICAYYHSDGKYINVRKYESTSYS